MREKRRAWYLANAEKAKACSAAFRENNPGYASAYYNANKEHKKQYQKQYRALNPSVIQARLSCRRACEKKAFPAWADARKITEFYAAANFLGMITGEWYHVDHIVPLQSKTVCGLHVEHNLQVILASANLRKGNRHWPDMP